MDNRKIIVLTLILILLLAQATGCASEKSSAEEIAPLARDDINIISINNGNLVTNTFTDKKLIDAIIDNMDQIRFSKVSRKKEAEILDQGQAFNLNSTLTAELKENELDALPQAMIVLLSDKKLLLADSETMKKSRTVRYMNQNDEASLKAVRQMYLLALETMEKTVNNGSNLAANTLDSSHTPNNPDYSNIAGTPDTPNTANSAFYIQYGNAYLPVSYVRNGHELLSGNGGWYSDVQSRLPEGLAAADAQRYAVKEMYRKGSPTPYDTHLPTGYIDENVICQNIAMCGDWDPFPVKVQYESYTLDHQPRNETWFNYFAKKIHAVSPETPVVIKEAWFFDLNGDGREEAFVNANNTFYSPEDDTPNPPAAQITAVYAFSAVFFGHGEVLETGKSAITTICNAPVNEQKGIFNSYQIDKESPEWTEHFVTAVQYDAEGRLITCPVFNYGEYDRFCEQEIVLCDIDGDGQAELIIMHYSIYSPLIVYRFNDEGRLVESFRLTTPA